LQLRRVEIEIAFRIHVQIRLRCPLGLAAMTHAKPVGPVGDRHAGRLVRKLDVVRIVSVVQHVGLVHAPLFRDGSVVAVDDVDELDVDRHTLYSSRRGRSMCPQLSGHSIDLQVARRRRPASPPAVDEILLVAELHVVELEPCFAGHESSPIRIEVNNGQPRKD
jgi:hypothetical protein